MVTPALRSRLMFVATAALLATASVGLADIPDVVIDLNVSNGFSDTFSPFGTDLGGGEYNFQGDVIDANQFMVAWNFNAVPDPANVAQLGSDFTFQNDSDVTLEFVITITLPLVIGTGPGANYLGTSAWGLTGEDGVLSTIGAGQSLWEVLVDGVEIDSLFDHPTEIGFTGIGSANLSAPAPVMGTTSVTSTMAIRLQFSLTPGDTAIVSGAFGVIPTPGVLALFGIAGVAGCRRRRKL